MEGSPLATETFNSQSKLWFDQKSLQVGRSMVQDCAIACASVPSEANWRLFVF